MVRAAPARAAARAHRTSCRCQGTHLPPRAALLAGPAWSGMPGVQALQQVVGGELDILVPPLGGPVLAGDDAHAVQTTQVAVDECVPGLGLVLGGVGEPEMPPRVLRP